MGFYIRRSVSVGPFRFNLSKSGIGLSMGVKGLRVGTGPRGNYVHMGRGGLYFRSALPSSGTATPLVPSPRLTSPVPMGNDPTVAAFEEIESATVLQLTDSSSADIVQQIAAKAKVGRLFPWAIIVSGLLLLILRFLGAPIWLLGTIALVSLVVCFLAHRRDVVARSVVLMYELDDAIQAAFGRLHSAFEAIQASGRFWHIPSSAHVLNRKYHAGAGNVVNRRTVTVRKGNPPILKTNIESILLPAGRQTLVFLPDRLLVFEGASVAGIDYGNLILRIGDTRFIEDSAPPSDATVVGSTWRYVNKSGGPDRRFANNAQLPIALYEEIHFGSASGLNETFQCSRRGIGEQLRKAITEIAGMTKERTLPSPPQDAQAPERSTHQP